MHGVRLRDEAGFNPTDLAFEGLVGLEIWGFEIDLND